MVTALEVEDRGDLRFNLALALFYQKKSAEARAQLQRLLGGEQPGTRDGDVYYYLVASYLQEGRVTEAKELFDAKRDLLSDHYRRSLETALERTR